MGANNLFADIPAKLPQELTEVLVRGEAARIERIVSRGHASPEGFWYDQPEDEWVVLVRGRARLRFDDGRPAMEMGAGDHLLIPAGQRHRVEWTDPDEDTVWVAVFLRAS